MKKQIIILAISLILLVLGMLSKGIIAVLLCFIALYLSGCDVLKECIEGIRKGEFFDECFLMSLAAISAFVIGEHHEGVAIMLFYQVGELFCHHAGENSRNSIKELMKLQSEEAFVERGGRLLKVSPEEVGIGEIIVVSPGQRVPLDGVIVKGKAAFDTSSLTGEVLPKDLGEGDSVLSGFVCAEAAVSVRVEKSYENSAVSKILKLTEESREKKSKTEKFITSFAKVYTPIVVTLAAILAILPPILGMMGANESIYRAISFLVVSCPCALVVSVPVAYFGAIGAAAKGGALIKGSTVLDALAKAEIAVFDKTGTLTNGEFEVIEICSVNMEKEELLTLCAAAEFLSAHPMAQFLKKYAGEINPENIKGFEEIAGRGVLANFKGKEIISGNAALMKEKEIAFEKAEGCVIYVAVDGKYEGYIKISDKVRSGAEKAIKELRKSGIKKCVMLTGDTAFAAENVAKRAKLDGFYHSLLPEGKVLKIEELTREGKVLFLGDGINDAPSIMRADVGVAMGALGSDAAIESADIVLSGDNLFALPKAMKISKKARRIAAENIVVSIGIKVLIMIAALLGISNLWISVFADVGVCIIAVLNALRIFK